MAGEKRYCPPFPVAISKERLLGNDSAKKQSQVRAIPPGRGLKLGKLRIGIRELPPMKCPDDSLL